MNCNYKVSIKDIQSKYTFKIFCAGSGGDLSDYYTKSETDTLLNGKENLSNKVTTLSISSTDTEYPSAKCVYDIIGDVETLLANLDDGNGVM